MFGSVICGRSNQRQLYAGFYKALSEGYPLRENIVRNFFFFCYVIVCFVAAVCINIWNVVAELSDA